LTKFFCDTSSYILPSSDNANKSVQNELMRSKRRRNAKDVVPDFYSFLSKDVLKT